jgi:uncharacterized protein
LKYLLFCLLLGYVFWRWREAQARRRAAPPPKQAEQTQTQTQTQTIEMVVCAHCGVHLPVSQALTVRSIYFCSAAHQKAHGA